MISIWSTRAFLSVTWGLRTVCTFLQFVQGLQRAGRASWNNWPQYPVVSQYWIRVCFEFDEEKM